jgi:predicted aspartyl protease
VTHAFDAQGRLIGLKVRIGGPSGDTVVQLALDTGATRTMISQQAMQLLGYDPSKSTEHAQVTTGSGVESVPRLSLESLEALGQTRTDFTVPCHTLPPTASVDGVLGLDFFRGQRLIIDFRTASITLE